MDRRRSRLHSQEKVGPRPTQRECVNMTLSLTVTIVNSRADVNRPIHNRGRGHHEPVEAVEGMAPQLDACAGVQRIHLTKTGDIDHAIRPCRRGSIETSSGTAPQQGAGVGVQRAHALAAADIDHAIRDDGRGIQLPTGVMHPQQGAGAGVQCIHVAVFGAEINHPIGRCGGRGRIGKEVGGIAPQQGARAGVQRIHVAVVGADIHHPIGH